ncbi:MAG TPA: hypothetical protein VHX66_18240 [Solirubrobacteraceae bacterium]|jgi:hypothetical protein|nr:hypothetical protein [Solirubrobacteraceae bacterium]
MAEPPDGPADDPRDPPEEPYLPEEPLGYGPDDDDEGSFDEEVTGEEESHEGDREQHLFEEPQIADPLEPHTEETAIAPALGEDDDAADEEAEPEPGEEEDSEAEGEAESADDEGAGPATGLHLIGSDEEDEEFSELRYHNIEETDYLSLEEAVHTPEEIRQRRLADKEARKRAGRQRLGVLFVAVAVIVVIILLTTGGGGGKSPTSSSPPSSPIAAAGTGPSYLTAGTSSALPSNILIADRNNGQLVAVTPKGQEIWSTPLSGPSDAYITTSGRSITVTEHSRMQVLVLGIVSHKIDYHYGHPNVAGSGINRLHDPATGQFLPNGQLVIADKSNCRIVFVTPPSHHRVTYLGRPKACVHNPPKNFGFPDAAFPTADGGLVVSELSPAWVDILGKDHTLVAEMQPKGLTAPYDANEYAPGKLIATNYADPGAVEEFDSQGKVTWTYDPKKGSGALDYPTLAKVLPDGNVLVSDARNDRVIVIDASTKKIIWQYGHTHHSGNGPGFLHTPDSAVLVPSAG